MPYSMTGIGRASGELDSPAIKLEVEIKSYNHRFLEISVKAPNAFLPFEEEIRKIIQEKVSRGHVVVFIQQDREIMGTKFEVDRPLMNAYLVLAKELKAKHKAVGKVDINALLAIPGVIRMSQMQTDTRQIFNGFKPILARALNDFLKMKRREGETTARDIERSLDKIEQQFKNIEKLVPERDEFYRQRLEELIREFKDTLDKDRFYQELVYISDRNDVSEETQRLRGHLTLFRESLEQDDHPGRRMNFLLQEIQREANTLSVKANFLKISESVVSIKEEIEKIREQVQNIE
jgi:uncharacterized protein (TIGR00255 family)